MPPAEASKPLFLDDTLALLAQKLNYLCREFRETKHDLDGFLDEYYMTVGEALAAFATVAPCPSAPSDIASETDQVRRVHTRSTALSQAGEDVLSIETEMRELYLLLVRRLHPDVADTHVSDPDAIKHVTHAYHHGLLGDLWKICFAQEWLEIRNFPAQTREGFLKHYHERLNENICVMENKLRSLYRSPEYELQQRVFAARLRGEDLIAHIAAHLHQEAKTELRRTEYRRIRAQLMLETL